MKKENTNQEQTWTFCYNVVRAELQLGTSTTEIKSMFNSIEKKALDKEIKLSKEAFEYLVDAEQELQK